jgi:PAS domain S-box-containing protein
MKSGLKHFLDERKLEQLLAGLRDVIYTVFVHTKEFAYVSPAFEKIFGYTAADIRALGGWEKFIRGVIQQDQFAQQEEPLEEPASRRMAKTNRPGAWWKCKDGSRVCIEDNRSAICQDGQHVENVVHDFDEVWQQMAVAALEKGFSEEDIFYATEGGGYSWSGSMSSMYAARMAPFEKLLKNPNSRLQKIGKISVNNFSRLRDSYLTHEKRAAVRGELA